LPKELRLSVESLEVVEAGKVALVDGKLLVTDLTKVVIVRDTVYTLEVIRV